MGLCCRTVETDSSPAKNITFPLSTSSGIQGCELLSGPKKWTQHVYSSVFRPVVGSWTLVRTLFLPFSCKVLLPACLGPRHGCLLSLHSTTVSGQLEASLWPRSLWGVGFHVGLGLTRHCPAYLISAPICKSISQNASKHCHMFPGYKVTGTRTSTWT